MYRTPQPGYPKGWGIVPCQLHRGSYPLREDTPYFFFLL